jgi:hypothetical protein
MTRVAVRLPVAKYAGAVSAMTLEEASAALPVSSIGLTLFLRDSDGLSTRACVQSGSASLQAKHHCCLMRMVVLALFGLLLLLRTIAWVNQSYSSRLPRGFVLGLIIVHVRGSSPLWSVQAAGISNGSGEMPLIATRIRV